MTSYDLLRFLACIAACAACTRDAPPTARITSQPPVAVDEASVEASAQTVATASASASATAEPEPETYPTRLQKFFLARLGRTESSCAIFRVSINPQMLIWHVVSDPIKTSGDDRFDRAARRTLQKLLDDRTPLPDPPRDVADLFKGRTVDVMLGSSCRYELRSK